MQLHDDDLILIPFLSSLRIFKLLIRNEFAVPMRLLTLRVQAPLPFSERIG